jgi:hypothetical protein
MKPTHVVVTVLLIVVCPVRTDHYQQHCTLSAQDRHLQRVTIPEAAYIQLRHRPPEYEQGNARNM